MSLGCAPISRVRASILDRGRSRSDVAQAPSRFACQGTGQYRCRSGVASLGWRPLCPQASGPYPRTGCTAGTVRSPSSRRGSGIPPLRSTAALLRRHRLFKPITPDKIGQRIGDWPADFDRAVLKAFCEATYRLIGNVYRQIGSRSWFRPRFRLRRTSLLCFRRHAALLAEPSRSWVWRGLTDTLSRYGNVQDLHKKQEPPPPGLVIDCAELALTALEKGSAAVRGEIPDGDTWYGRPESEWSLALDLADASLIWSPVRDDSIQQERFECALSQALERRDSLVQLIILTAVRPWHWFRNEERKKLHWQTLVRDVRDPRVSAWAIGALTYHSETEQLTAFKTFLMHAGAPHAVQLARQLGEYAGRRSLVVVSNGQRSRFAELAHDVVAHPDCFPLLTGEDCRVEFFRCFAFGLKEAARQTAPHTKLAPDFGSWNLQIWRELRGRQCPRAESERIVLFAIHWLEKPPQAVVDREVLRPWWQCLLPLLEAVVTEGKAADCFTLFLGLRGGHYNDIRQSRRTDGLDFDACAPTGDWACVWSTPSRRARAD